MSKKKKLAYARVIDKIRLPEQYHRGRKLSEVQKEEIRQRYKTEKTSYHKLAKEYGVSYGTIQCTINPRAYQQMIEAGRRYHTSEKYKAKKKKIDPMDLRRYKKKTYRRGKNYY